MSSAFIKIVLLVSLVIAIVNDLGVVATGFYEADDKARRVAEATALDYRVNQNDDMAVAVAQETAGRENVVLTGFQITENLIRVSITIPPRKTWIANRISSLRPYISAQSLVEVPIK